MVHLTYLYSLHELSHAPLDSKNAKENLTVAEVARVLNVSHDTVHRMFISESGVLNVGSERTIKRPYRVLRIPHDVLKRVIAARNHASRSAESQIVVDRRKS
jgi:hypothetical protein